MEREVHSQVIVVGAGNAALCAAIAAAERGAHVIVMERAPKEERGGNSTLTGHMRFAYNSVEELIPLFETVSREDIKGISDVRPRYTQADFYDDIMHVTDGRADPELVHLLVSQSYPTIRWLRSKGHTWVPSYESPTSANVVSMSGRGLGLQDRAFAAAERMGVQIHYDTRAMELLQDSQGRLSGVRALTPQGFCNYYGKAVVLACGGFESNAEMRARYLGPGWDTVKMRGVPFNTGDGLRMALEVGALPHGSWSSCHASPQDLNRPGHSLPTTHRLGEQWNRYSYPFSIMVNVHGQRFVDEGENLRGLTYAKTGRTILAQPGGVAFQIFDAKCREFNLIHDYETATGAQADTLETLAKRLGIDAQGLVQTVGAFNAAVQPGAFNPFARDGKKAIGIAPPKSNWALTIDKPPFEGYPVCCGITFTFGGLRMNSRGQVIHTMDRPLPGLYVAGEMVGGVWHWNYPSGSGMMLGAVFGRIVGTSAAEEALAS